MEGEGMRARGPRPRGPGSRWHGPIAAFRGVPRELFPRRAWEANRKTRSLRSRIGPRLNADSAPTPDRIDAPTGENFAARGGSAAPIPVRAGHLGENGSPEPH